VIAVKNAIAKFCLSMMSLFLIAGILPPRTSAASAAPEGRYQLADYAGEIRESAPRQDSYYHIDTPAMIEKLKDLHVNTYYYLIYHSPATDWDDLRNEFAPAAKAAGIQIVVYLVPPTETGSTQYSGPYKTDYVAWAGAIAQLSLQYPNIVGWAIDDFSLNLNTFTPAYLAQMKQAAKSVNPNLMFTPQLYTVGLTPAFLQSSAAYIDGVIIAYRDDPHRNTQVWASEQSQIDSMHQLLQPYNLPLYWMVYASRLSGTPGSPTADYVNHVTQTALDNIRNGQLAGIITYVLYKNLTPGLETYDLKASSGQGYLSLFVPGGNPTIAGHYAAASQTIYPDGSGHYSLSFQTMDEGPNVAGYHVKQLLVDNQVVWEQDTAAVTTDTQWQTVTVTMDTYLANKSSATLTFRLFENKGVTNFYQNAGFDRVQASGFTLQNGDFEDRSGWSLTTANPDMISDIYIYDPDRRAHAYQAVKSDYTLFSDLTPPVIQISSPANMTYTDDQTVEIGLSVTDEGSGVNASQTAATLDGVPVLPGTAVSLYTLPLGSHVLAVTAADMAGNTAQELVQFQTTATVSSLLALVSQFVQNGSIDNNGVANSLKVKLEHGNLQAFVNEVRAQSGKHVAASCSEYLIRDAQFVMSNQ
jgi:hypothetical protein